MIHKRIDLWNENEYSYPMAFGFVPNVVSYLHEAEEDNPWPAGVRKHEGRPCILVVPGGGYGFVSPTEGEIVAKEFYNRGFQAFVLTYTTNLLMSAPLGNQPLKDISRAIRMIRKDAKQFQVDPTRLAVCGFSAGGHLSGSVCVHYQDIIDEDSDYTGISNRPDAAILAYPVITSGEYAHEGSFQALLGQEAAAKEKQYMSLEKQVTPQTPPCFLWQTATDASVPVQNSYLFAEACERAQIPYAHHVFSQGHHGLSLANEVWAAGEYGTPYTMEQTVRLVERIKTDGLQVPEEAKVTLQQYDDSGNPIATQGNQVNHEAAVWPELAESWLRQVWAIHDI